jgi:hypothetical protein
MGRDGITESVLVLAIVEGRKYGGRASRSPRHPQDIWFRKRISLRALVCCGLVQVTSLIALPHGK